MTAAALVLLASCGPEPATVTTPYTAPPPEPEPVPDKAELHLAKVEESLRAAVAKLNQAVDQQDPKLLAEAISKKTFDLIIEQARKYALFTGTKKEIDAAYVLEDLNRQLVVFSFDSVEPHEKTAVLRAMAGSYLYLKADISIVEEDGNAVIDISSWYKQAVANLDKAIADREDKEAAWTAAAKKLVADLNKALNDADTGLFSSALTDETIDLAIKYLGLLPKKKGGKKKPTLEKLVAFLASRIEKIEFKAMDIYTINAVLIIHPAAPPKSKKTKQLPAPFEQNVLLQEMGKEGQFVFNSAAWLKKENARLVDAHGGLTKVKWTYYMSKDMDKDKSCQKAFEISHAGKPGPGKSGSDLYSKQLASEEEFKKAFPTCGSNIDWKKHRLVQVSVRNMINTSGFKVSSVKKKVNMIIVAVGGHHYCAGAPLPVSWSAWILIPAGEETVIVDSAMTSYKGPCLMP